MAPKRKPRAMPEAHKQIDTTVYLDFEALGTVKDPCFGKHFSIKAAECKRCGDAEICSIACSNKLLLEIDNEASKSRFKDTEEGELIDSQNIAMAKTMAARAGKKGTWCSLGKMVGLALTRWNLTDKEKGIVKQRLIKAAQDSGKIKINKENTKYKLK
jgi:hypothetical protein